MFNCEMVVSYIGDHIVSNQDRIVYSYMMTVVIFSIKGEPHKTNEIVWEFRFTWWASEEIKNVATSFTIFVVNSERQGAFGWFLCLNIE